MRKPRREPYIWVTWVTGLLASDDHCKWAAWFKAHFKYAKVPRQDGKLNQWKSDHGAMVNRRAQQLRDEGYTVYLEDQNKFSFLGKSGAVVAGTPDIVAVKGDHALVVDAKSGKRRDKDYWQVCIYMIVLPMTHEAVKGKTIRGEVEYTDGRLKIDAVEAVDVRDVIIAQFKETGGATIPEQVPSQRECKFCDISKADCPKRIETEDAATVAVGANDDF